MQRKWGAPGGNAAGPALILVFFLVLGADAPAIAQEDATAGLVVEGRPRRSDTLDYITIDVREKDLREVLQGIGRQVDINIVADLEIDEKVTVNLDSVDWRKALDVIARQTNCTIIEESPRLIRFSQPPAISIEFKDAELKVVLDLLAKQSGANIVIAEDVIGKVSLSLRNVPWREALDTIVKTAGYVTVQEKDGISEIIRVVRPETLTKQLETRIIKLRYIRPPERYEAIIRDIEKQASDQGGEEILEPQDEFSVLTALRKALSEDGEMDFDSRTNSLILKDVAPRLDAIQKIIDEIDVEPALVQVEVKFVATTSDDIFEFGMKYDKPDTPEREGLKVSAFGADPQQTVTSREAFVGQGQTGLDPIIQYGGTWPFDIGRWEAIGTQFGALGILDFTQTRFLLSLVRDDENSKIIQEPRLTTLDNYPSTIFVGESVPFAVQRVQQDQNGNVTVEIDENDRSPVNIGFTLYISPHVIPGTDTVYLNVIPKVSTLTGTTSVITGFDRFSFSQGGQSVSFIDLPRESSQTVVTYLRVESGHTAVIGGLHTERRVSIDTRIPFISRIPIVGELFRWRRRSNDVEHLLILITPKVIKDTDISDELYQKALRDAEQYDYFIRKYGRRAADPGTAESDSGED
ncbi:MAG: secretin N-terminal domain-containing protein [Planctomycetota bacterium]